MSVKWCLVTLLAKYLQRIYDSKAPVFVEGSLDTEAKNYE